MHDPPPFGLFLRKMKTLVDVIQVFNTITRYLASPILPWPSAATWSLIMPSAGPSHRHDVPQAWRPLVNRRDLLRIASLGLASSFVPSVTPTIAKAAEGGGSQLKGTARSVILLWMAGGVTHIDSFDPKP